MAVRKNAKHLTTTERETLVRAFVRMHADIVNPAAPAADRYSRWDEYVAVHHMIQNVDAPSATNVNFGHGGTGAYGFLPWHRYFLLRLEEQLRTYVPGEELALPYWDWTDPSVGIMTETFLGPDGDPLNGNQVRRGYFAADAPGTGTNPTPAPPWWPAGLTGWRLHPALGVLAGPLRRRVRPVAELPSVASVRSAMAKTTYPAFQLAVEAGAGTAPFHQLHNGLHGWFGSGTHMSSTVVSPFDPIFYLHHCNIDRLWAMWQMDGHATDYPVSGGDPEHHLNDPMYPWVGGAPGYDSNNDHPPIALPDVSAFGVVRAADVLDHRALGYSYDTQVVIGVSLDRTGSMTGVTPDPMTTGAPDVSKWEAAKRGVSAFLQDCETAYQAAEAYVVAGVETFRSTPANEFTPVFAGTPYGLVKPGGGYGAAAFDSAIAAQAPGGGTPLADALVNAHATLVQPPFASLPAGERRYLAILTDGLLTSGSPLSSVADGSLTDTAVFAMGFGTGADVDYPTLAALVAKGEPLASTQVFHGENAGTIDKFYSQALAAALGFTPVMDPVLELFEGEHTHLSFDVTSADDAFFLTAQGMDFTSEDWGYVLIAPDGRVVHAENAATHGHGHGHGGHGAHGPLPAVSTTYRAGRLSVFVNRDNAGAATWTGPWTLMVSWRAHDLDAMVMLDVGDLLFPVSAGPVRGPRWARLLRDPAERLATRAVTGKPRHRLDVRPNGTGRGGRPACSTVVNVYARSRLRTAVVPRPGRKPDTLAFDVVLDVLDGATEKLSGLARLVAPTKRGAALARRVAAKPGRKSARLPEQGDGRDFDAALAFAEAEERDPGLAEVRDEEAAVVTHDGSAPHVHVEAAAAGVYHLGVYVEGLYCACCGNAGGGHDHGADAGHGEDGAGHGPGGGHGDGGGDGGDDGRHGHDGRGGQDGHHAHGGAAGAAGCADHRPEPFTRLLTATAAVAAPAAGEPPAKRDARRRPRGGGR